MNFESSFRTNQFESDHKTESQPVSRLLISRQWIETGTAEVNVSHEDIFMYVHVHIFKASIFQTNQRDQMLFFPFLRAL